MDSLIKISVVIPAFNASEYITNAIQSVFNQTEAVCDVIVIDDGSKDSTFETVESFAKKNRLENLKIIRQENGGPSKARNKGVSVAQGNFIAFLDSDDIWLPEKISIQKKYLQKYPDVSIISTLMMQEKKEKINSEIEWLEFSKALWKNPFFTSSVIVKKSIFNLYKFDENQKYSEDFKLYLEILRNNKCLLIRKKLIDYNSDKEIRQTSLSSQLWKMEKGELENFKYFYNKQYINPFFYTTVSIFSLLKYIRRVLINKYYKQ